MKGISIEERVLGCLLGAAVGDAMGAATEIRTREQIEEYFNGPVKDFEVPPADTFARGNKKGQITDDFSIAHVALETILDNAGEVSESIAVKAILNWADHEEWFERFAGPTTRGAILALRSDTKVEPKWGFDLVAENDRATNGAAMKASPIALLAGTDENLAFDQSMIISMVTHSNNTALAGAAAVACATSMALRDNASLNQIIDAGIRGAIKGDKYGRAHAMELSNPSVSEKIKHAVAMVTCCQDMDEAIDCVAEVVGTSVFVYESVPAAFAFVSMLKDDPMEPILAAVNAGSDTDTVATMVGGIVGAYCGASAFPKGYLEIIDGANNFNLKDLAKRIIDSWR